MNIDPNHDLDSWDVPTVLDSLASRWMDSKEAERKATEHRRELEDAMLSLIGISEAMEGTENAEAPGGYRIKVTGRMNRKVDGDKLQEIAIENGLQDHLGSLFRWKPEINKKAWDAASSGLTRPLMDAITTTPGRPSFSITKEDN